MLRILPSSLLALLAGLSCVARGNLINLDENQLGDIWQGVYHADSIDPEADNDGDGQRNRDEHRAGTDPNDPDDRFSIRSVSVLPNQLLVRWPSVTDVSYDFQYLARGASGWSTLQASIPGSGGPQWTSVDAGSLNGGFVRISMHRRSPVPIPSGWAGLDHDTDHDGQSDIAEFFAKTDPFRSVSRLAIDRIKLGTACEVTWTSQAGKRYRLEATDDPSASWESLAGPIRGNGGPMTLRADITGKPHSFFRMAVWDTDSDGDGLTDWEEIRMGYDPELASSSLTGTDDRTEFVALLDTLPSLSIQAREPVAIVEEWLQGELVVSREGAPDALEVPYQISGDALSGTDFAPLSGTLYFAYGEREATISIVPLAGAATHSDLAVQISLLASEDYNIAGPAAASVTLFRSRPLVATDFGAAADGVTDDTAAVQAALDALEASTSHNTLYFPAGTYRLAGLSADSESATSRYRILRLGATDLAGRDLRIVGAPGSRLYSEVRPIRAHILEARASFRSLAFEGMTFEQDPGVLGLPLTAEPNGSDGISLVQVDGREVASVDLLDCSFFNCHGALRMYGGGYDTRGKLRTFRMRRCTVSNPWGANSVHGSKIMGGGQQVNVSPWTDTAIYRDNFFDGGSRIHLEPERNPLGRKKDGCHFGSPLRLEFINNLVEDMAVEAVYQLHEPYMGKTTQAMVLPGLGHSTTVKVSDHPSTYQPGQTLAIRGPLPNGKTESVSLVVETFDPASMSVTVRNDGHNTYDIGGVSFKSLRPIYLQGNNATRALVERNIVLANKKEGQRALAGIAANAAARIRNNFIQGFTHGVLIYGNSRTPLFPGGKGTVIEANVIEPRDTTIDPGANTYGVHSWGPEEIVRNNLVSIPISSRIVGLALRGPSTIVEGNTVIARNVVRNGYDSTLRAVGVGVGNTSLNVVARRNTTYGFDVGMGPIDKFQSIPHYLIDHRSIEDELPIDPRGVINE